LRGIKSAAHCHENIFKGVKILIMGRDFNTAFPPGRAVKVECAMVINVPPSTVKT
jgi:hypothetical protein